MSKVYKHFLMGIGQVLDVTGATIFSAKRHAGSSRYADAKALRSDWNRVGKSMTAAIQQAKKEAGEKSVTDSKITRSKTAYDR